MPKNSDESRDARTDDSQTEDVRASGVPLSDEEDTFTPFPEPADDGDT